MSRNDLFKHLGEEHDFCREWQEQPEAGEKTSPRACDASGANQCPAASTWQIQSKGRSSSAVIKPSNALASKTTRLAHVNSYAALYKADDDECSLLPDDDQISDIDALCRAIREEEELEFALEAAIAPPPPRYICPEAAPMRIVGTAVRHSDLIHRISANHDLFI